MIDKAIEAACDAYLDSDSEYLFVRMRAAITAYERACWQPIESAPKDKPIILTGQWNSGKWEVICDQWLLNRFPFVGWGQPTNWRPLPPPPENEK